jgi:hypothetical protein
MIKFVLKRILQGFFVVIFPIILLIFVAVSSPGILYGLVVLLAFLILSYVAGVNIFGGPYDD